METLLKTARQQSGLTIDEVSKCLNIRKIYLEFLENNDFKQIPGGSVYVQGYLKLYADHLGIKYEDVMPKIFLEQAKLQEELIHPTRFRNDKNYSDDELLRSITTILAAVFFFVTTITANKYFSKNYDDNLAMYMLQNNHKVKIENNFLTFD